MDLPESCVKLRQQGLESYKSKEYEKALGFFEKAFKDAPLSHLVERGCLAVSIVSALVNIQPVDYSRIISLCITHLQNHELLIEKSNFTYSSLCYNLVSACIEKKQPFIAMHQLSNHSYVRSDIWDMLQNFVGLKLVDMVDEVVLSRVIATLDNTVALQEPLVQEEFTTSIKNVQLSKSFGDRNFSNKLYETAIRNYQQGALHTSKSKSTPEQGIFLLRIVTCRFNIQPINYQEIIVECSKALEIPKLLDKYKKTYLKLLFYRVRARTALGVEPYLAMHDIQNLMAMHEIENLMIDPQYKEVEKMWEKLLKLACLCKLKNTKCFVSFDICEDKDLKALENETRGDEDVEAETRVHQDVKADEDGKARENETTTIGHQDVKVAHQETSYNEASWVDLKTKSWFHMADVEGVQEQVSEELQVDLPVKKQETRDEMLSRHRKEISQLQDKETTLKKGAAKGSKAEQKAKKKQVEEEISHLSAKLKEKHADELASLGYNSTIGNDKGKIDNLVKAIAGVSVTTQPDHSKPSKSAKRRGKRAQEEAAREQRIQEEQDNIISDRMIEEEKLEKKLNPIGLTKNEIKPDGHCLYRAVEDQLAFLSGDSSPYDYQELRKMVAAYMRNHASDFLPFFSSDNIEDGNIEERFEKYCSEVECTAAWGGQLELGALTHCLKKHIMVFSGSFPDVEMGKEYKKGDDFSIKLSYHRHAFGLGEHYNSVVRI